MEELGIHDIASTIKHVSTRRASAKLNNSGNKKNHREGLDSSEYLPKDKQAKENLYGKETYSQDGTGCKGIKEGEGWSTNRSTSRSVNKVYKMATHSTRWETNDLNRPPSPMMDWSYSHDAHEDNAQHEEQHEEQIHPSCEAPKKQGPIKPRPPTRGIMLDKIT
uniref:Uncharacterized protein n=1 Tax=Leersia perrieri TaxID=77586 RepID=A0A0D9W3W4_9ORYZ